MKTCSVEECSSVSQKKGMCQTHYLVQWYATKTETCANVECDRAAWSKGLCLRHYKRQWRYGADIVHQLPADYTLEQRLRHYGWTVTESGCWEWGGRIEDRQGYGWLDYGNTQIGAHRASYLVWVGPIDTGMLICHSCDNPPCMNPEHLWQGTNQENMIDMATKGRGGKARGERSGTSVLKESQVREMRQLRAEGAKVIDLAKKYGVQPSCVSAICLRRSWKWLN